MIDDSLTAEGGVLYSQALLLESDQSVYHTEGNLGENIRYCITGLVAYFSKVVRPGSKIVSHRYIGWIVGQVIVTT